MNRRTTIMLDPDIHLELRNIQSALIRTTHENHTLSRVINELLKVGIKTKYRKGLK